MKNYLLIAIFMTAVFFVAVKTASACTCIVPIGKSDKELVDSAKTNAELVFVGRVIKIVKDRNRHGAPTGGYTAVFEVSEIWKGKQRKQMRLSQGQCCLCVLSFSKRKEYLVYANYDLTNTTLTADTCGRTTDTNDPQLKVDRQYLGASVTLKK